MGFTFFLIVEARDEVTVEAEAEVEVEAFFRLMEQICSEKR